MKAWRALAATAALSLTLAGCGGGPGASDNTLTVWLMDGSAEDALIAELNAEFEQSHPGMKVDYQVQQWNGIQDRLTTALASDDPPDVIELGNSQNPQFSAEGTLLDLTADAEALNKPQWVPALAESGAWEGKQYGVPFYAANRVVVYNKELFDKAGITQLPTNREELLGAIAKLEQTHGADPEFQSLYLPGQSWYALLSFIWDSGGELAVPEGPNYKGALDTEQARDGIAYYQQLVKESGTLAPADTDEAEPQQAEVYAKGKVAMMIALPWEVQTAAEQNPRIAEISGAFPIPSKFPGRTAPVFLGGSNLAIPAGSADAEAAKDYLKLLTSQKYQTKIAESGVVPGASQDTSALEGNPVSAAMAIASKSGKVPPAVPQWAAVEAGQNPLKDMMTAVLTGQKSIVDATMEANDKIDQLLAAKN
ncbi:extracellular solute-binding protein [Saccharopolyspora hirsuta]|uniref:Extracellular solute-binding protein n=1 Tax=Saccharopolyspora hirsuta TaxID=1837 RepID=A0A5M7BI39_SACHI|nr:extracellular solute-binding protein [Saccharopolyspora hirsuta]KAA5829526.1 extracellular solute-binding protein [Saccharopolyspora hirsuta]